METDNRLSEQAQLAWVKMFERFITETALPDEIQTLNMNTARKYREWLVKSDYAITTIQSAWGYLFTLVKKLERKHGYDFGMDKDKFEPIKDKRDREAKRASRVALTEDEVNLLANFAVPDDKLEKPGRRDPRGRRPLDHGKFFNFDPQGILADGVIFISAYYFLEALILRTLSPVSSI